MARKYRSRNRSKSRYKKKYRKYRKLYRRSRKISKSKRIKGRKRLPGNSTRISMRTEQKFLNVSNGGAFAFPRISAANPSLGIVMATDSQIVNLQGAFPMPLPAQGVDVNQITGNKFIYQFIDLRFQTAPVSDPAVTVWNQDTVRFIVVSERQNTSAINNNLWVAYTAGQASNISVPINTRYWKIHLDKAFYISSGQVPAQILPIIGGGIAIPAYSQTLASPVKSWRFVIPFRQNANILVANWAPEKRTYVIMMTSLANTYQILNLNCRSYFKDP